MPTGRRGCLHAQARRFPVHVFGISGLRTLNLRLIRVTAAKPALFSGGVVVPAQAGPAGVNQFTAHVLDSGLGVARKPAPKPGP